MKVLKIRSLILISCIVASFSAFTHKWGHMLSACHIPQITFSSFEWQHFLTTDCDPNTSFSCRQMMLKNLVNGELESKTKSEVIQILGQDMWNAAIGNNAREVRGIQLKVPQ